MERLYSVVDTVIPLVGKVDAEEAKVANSKKPLTGSSRIVSHNRQEHIFRVQQRKRKR